MLIALKNTKVYFAALNRLFNPSEFLLGLLASLPRLAVRSKNSSFTLHYRHTSYYD